MLVSALASSRIEHVNLWDRDNELGAPIADMAHLLDDFLWKYWPGSVDRVNRLDRDIHPRRVATVLIRVTVYRKIQKIGADSAVIEQCVVLTWRAVAEDGRRTHKLGKLH